MITIITVFLSMLLFIIQVIFVLLIPFILVALIYLIVQLARGRRFQKRSVKSGYKKPSKFKRIFYDFPIRFVEDIILKNPDEMSISGLHLFAGEQGSGKTMSAVEFAMRLKQKYPLCKIRSNIDLNFQDDKIEDIDDIILSNNGIYGQVDIIDELQNWFNSNESKDFPVEMLQEICQQRKQHKIIVGTSQVFNRVSKAFREQVSILYKPVTLMGCCTIVFAYKPKIKDDGTVDKLKFIKVYFFVHNDKLRNSYDTYEKVKRLSVKGFKTRSEQITRDKESNTLTEKK
jgi:hypothetical protein